MGGKTFASQLATLGLVDKDQARRADEERLSRERGQIEANNGTLASQHTKKALKDPSLEDLKTAGPIRDFLEIAKRLIKMDPSHIGDIITQAHRYKNDPKGKQLVWRIYQVRDLLPKCPVEKRETFIDRAFRRHDPKVEIPD